MLLTLFFCLGRLVDGLRIDLGRELSGTVHRDLPESIRATIKLRLPFFRSLRLDLVSGKIVRRVQASDSWPEKRGKLVGHDGARSTRYVSNKSKAGIACLVQGIELGKP